MGAANDDTKTVTLERYLSLLDYSVDLQHIIEDLCHDRDIKVPETGARFHYDMAVKYRAATKES
jgi:hypothetical protein